MEKRNKDSQLHIFYRNSDELSKRAEAHTHECVEALPSPWTSSSYDACDSYGDDDMRMLRRVGSVAPKMSSSRSDLQTREFEAICVPPVMFFEELSSPKQTAEMFADWPEWDGPEETPSRPALFDFSDEWDLDGFPLPPTTEVEPLSPPWWDAQALLGQLRAVLQEQDPWQWELLFDPAFVPPFLGVLEDASLYRSLERAQICVYQWLRIKEVHFFHTFSADALWFLLHPLLKQAIAEKERV